MRPWYDIGSEDQQFVHVCECLHACLWVCTLVPHVYAGAYFWPLICSPSSPLSQRMLHLRIEMDCPVILAQSHGCVSYVYNLLYRSNRLNMFHVCAHTHTFKESLFYFPYWTLNMNIQHIAGFRRPYTVRMCVNIEVFVYMHGVIHKYLLLQ